METLLHRVGRAGQCHRGACLLVLATCECARRADCKAATRVCDNGQRFFWEYLGCSAEISRAKKYDIYEQF